MRCSVSSPLTGKLLLRVFCLRRDSSSDSGKAHHRERPAPQSEHGQGANSDVEMGTMSDEEVQSDGECSSDGAPDDLDPVTEESTHERKA